MNFDLTELDKEQTERLLEVSNLTVFTERFSDIYKAIKNQHSLSVLNNFKSRANNIMIYGPSGAGKSTIVEYYRDKYPEREIETEDKSFSSKPVLYVSLPNDKNPKAAPRAILHSLGAPPRRSTESASELNAAFKDLAEKTGVEVIIIDEWHNAFKGGTKNDIVRAATWVKTVINDTKRLVVLVGLEDECKTLLDMDPEVETRFPRRFKVDFYDENSFSQWLALLDSIDEKLPFSKRSNLADQELAVRLLIAAEGRLSYLMERIIQPAAYTAIFEDTDYITIDQLFEASQKHLELPDNKNPLNLASVPLESLKKLKIGQTK